MTLLRTLAYSTLMALVFVLAGTALAKDDSATRKIFSSGDDATVSIGANGAVLVRGAEVSSVHDGSITAQTAWEDATLTWTIDTDTDTSYVGASGSASQRRSIEEGDTISFAGMLEGSLRIAAHTVRNWSEDSDTDRTHLTGEVTRVGGGSFVVSSGDRRIEVDVDSDTTILIGKENADLADLETGTKVRVVGSYDSDGEFSATSVTVIAAKANNEGKRGWHGIFDFFSGWKTTWGNN